MTEAEGTDKAVCRKSVEKGNILFLFLSHRVLARRRTPPNGLWLQRPTRRGVGTPWQ